MIKSKATIYYCRFIYISETSINNSLRIAVNTRFLQKNKLEGIGRFTFETLRRMVLNHADVEFIFCFDRKFDSSFIFAPNVKPVIIYPQARHPFLFLLWFEYSLPKVLIKYDVDVFLSTDGFLPLRSNIKSLSVIHDIAFEHYPKDIDWLGHKYYKYFFPKFAEKATRLATVSSFSKNDIAEKYNINENKIDVVYNGVSEVFKPLTELKKQEVKKRIANGIPYFVCTGSIHPRKNILTLLKAFERLKSNNNLPHKLVLAGRKAWKTSKEEAFLKKMHFKKDVILTGRITDAELSEIVASAVASVYPSYFEGFGLPVVEAFACGAPVITTKNTAMEEIVKDAAYLFDALNVFDLEAAMLKLAGGNSDVKEKVEKGLAIAAEYSWDKTAEKLWESLIKTMA